VLGAVNVLRDLCELGGRTVCESRILLRHAFNDIGFRVSLVHQLTRVLADSDGVRSVFVSDARAVKRGQKVPIRVGLGRRGQADRRTEARKHYKQSHGFILVRIGSIVLRLWTHQVKILAMFQSGATGET
jgi:hypothetical protein